MDKLNVRIEAARLAVESGANKETFTEMARVIEKYIIGTSELLEYENPNAAILCQFFQLDLDIFSRFNVR